MTIRRYMPSDCEWITKLFYDTVHTVNARDYTQEQLDAWATGKVDISEWHRSLSEHDTLVAVTDHLIVGFADMDLQDNLTEHASIIAKPFFLHR